MNDWRPGASRAALVARAGLFARLRQFFAERDILEVDTPLLCRYGVTDPAIEPLVVPTSAASAAPRFLQSSPEYAMKRLLAAGSGAIYQLGKAFRDGEVGPRHNPEFTLLEWYRPGFSLDALIDEVDALLGVCLGRAGLQRLEYREVFLEVLGVDPWLADLGELRALARSRVDCSGLELDHDGWLDLLMSHCIEDSLKDRGIVALRHYPPSQAALARCVQRGEYRVAERFEVYVDGIELANGYRELLDPAELRRRAAQDNEKRLGSGQAQRDLDPRLLAALDAGMPDCSGVALGVDRLLMLAEGAATLTRVLPFDWERS